MSPDHPSFSIQLLCLRRMGLTDGEELFLVSVGAVVFPSCLIHLFHYQARPYVNLTFLVGFFPSVGVVLALYQGVLTCNT